MSFVIFTIAGIAVLIGFIFDAALLGMALLLTTRSARRRRHVWPAAGLLTVITTIMIIAIIALLPYQTVRSGTDYDIAAMNLAIMGFGYTISIGVGALVGALLTCALPARSTTVALSTFYAEQPLLYLHEKSRNQKVAA